MTELVLTQLQMSLNADLRAFMPELILCATIVFMLLLRLLPRMDRSHMGIIALALSALALAWSVGQWANISPYDPRVGDTTSVKFPNFDLFSGLLVFDNFAIFLKMFLLIFLIAVIALAMLTGIPDREDSADFFVLLLGSTLGMMLMTSAQHLLMVFLAVEMASLPSYALAGFLKGRRQSSEAALKYVVYGGGASGVMLYGISLLAGKYGTGYLPDVLAQVALSLSGEADLLVVMGLFFIMVGVAFKLSAVPFHFWCPDVFEGAAAEVGGFLSVASKAAALALLARFVMPLAGVPQFVVPVLAFFAALTTTFGNLAAYSQTNLKRLLAYSTISHAGFMMMGLAALSNVGADSVLFYLGTYFLMNLGAFAVVAFLRNATGAEDLREFRGLIHRSPILVCALGVFLLSLLGLPPLAGFAAKFQIFMALFDGLRLNASGANSAVVQSSLYALILVGGLNTVLALFYYVKVLKIMVLEKSVEEVEGKAPKPLIVPAGQTVYAIVLAALVLFVGVFWNQFATRSRKGAADFPTIAIVRGANK